MIGSNYVKCQLGRAGRSAHQLLTRGLLVAALVGFSFAQSASARDYYVHPTGGLDTGSALYGSDPRWPYRTLDFAMQKAREHAGPDNILLAAGTHVLEDPVFVDDGVYISGTWYPSDPHCYERDYTDRRKNECSWFRGSRQVETLEDWMETIVTGSLTLYDLTQEVVFQDITFADSTTTPVNMMGATLKINSCKFLDNRGFDAGAIDVQDLNGRASELNIFDSTFERNTAQRNTLGSGGAITITAVEARGDTFIDRSVFRYNESAGDAGAISALSKVTMTVANSVFCGNRGDDAGVMYLGFYPYAEPGNPRITFVNTSMGRNEARYGGAIVRDSGLPKLIVQNSILWDNLATSSDGHDSIDQGGASTRFAISHSFIEDLGTLDVSSESSRDRSPRWRDAASCDLDLTSGSPAINAGDRSVLGAHIASYDVEWDVRIQDGEVDAGAYEF